MDIEIRAWNSAESKMYYNVGIRPVGNGSTVFDENGPIEDMYGSRPTTMLYIGLRDKHGKKIFVGDILR